MQIQQAHHDSTEYVWLNMYATGNEFLSKIGTDVGKVNLRGVIVCFDRSTGAGEAPVGARCTIGAPLNIEQRFGLGPLASDMWLDTSSGIDGTSWDELLNMWVLVQIYGYCDRIWLAERQTTFDAYLSAIVGLGNGSFTMTKEAAVNGQQRLTGTLVFTVSSPARTRRYP